MRLDVVFIRTIAATAMVAVVVHSVAAVEVLDQQNDLTGSAAADSTSGGFTENAQTFTVGVTGTLARIEVQIENIFLEAEFHFRRTGCFFETVFDVGRLR